MSKLLSIISVTYNDAWPLLKTSRSVFHQDFTDFEYIVVDGNSNDGTQSLVEFWTRNGLISKSISEPDTGVYSAMNKGARLATGDYVCFLNAGDVFADRGVLARVAGLLDSNDFDGVLGWGELNNEIWGSWVEDEAFKLSSLGFCHQSLFVRRSLLLKTPFDERPFKTDSDTLQLGSLYADHARIPIVPEIWAIRSGASGLSANLERTRHSIKTTLMEQYPGLTEAMADVVIDFRRTCSASDQLLLLMQQADARLARHLAYMVLDTLFKRQSAKLEPDCLVELLSLSKDSLARDKDVRCGKAIERLIFAQSRRDDMMCQKEAATAKLQSEITAFGAQEEARIDKLHTSGLLADPNKTPVEIAVSLTSFPARLRTAHLVVRSLLAQTCPPREIHLWLGRDEVPNENWLPKKLLALKEFGLQIHFAPRTCHHYDKFLHNYALNERQAFVIVDDDVIYPPDAIETLLTAHHQYPSVVVANRCHQIGFTPEGALAPYQDWEREVNLPRPSLQLLPTGAGGVLYPPGFLSDAMATNQKNILASAPFADDIWLKFCALARSIPTLATRLSDGAKWYHRYTPTMRAGTLMDTNVERGVNDMQIACCAEWLTRVRPDWKRELREEQICYAAND